jgi:hypothetical protein
VPPAHSAPAYTLTCTGNDGWTLQVDFKRVGDRFEQTVTRIDRSGNPVAEWRDVHDSDSGDWPASPPIQELSLEAIGGKNVLLGVGRAGKSHWSVSIETTEVDSAPAIHFDFACRCPESPNWLGTTYEIQSGDTGTATTDHALQLACAEDARLTRLGLKQIKIEPLSHPPKWPGTVRWRYAIH